MDRLCTYEILRNNEQNLCKHGGVCDKDLCKDFVPTLLDQIKDWRKNIEKEIGNG